MKTKVGIDRIHFYLPPKYVDMGLLAEARGVDPNKYLIGIGQEKMAVTDATIDIVSMGLNAAYPIIQEEDKDLIDQVIFATESAFDYSKAAATYLHESLGIHAFAKSYEIKEACYGATAALQIACDYVRLRPERKVLVVASDIARYGLATGGEPTQGAGAIAMLISKNPSVLALEEDSISLTDNQYDFWRPDYLDYPLVEGKFSTQLYNQCFIKIMEEAANKHLDLFDTLKGLCFHLPFSKMGKKALQAYQDYLNSKEGSLDPKVVLAFNRWLEVYPDLIQIGKQVGNIYTGSLYLGLISLLVNGTALNAGDKLGLFSYGSGAVAELLVGQLQVDYRKALKLEDLNKRLAQRQELSIEEYEMIFSEKLPNDGKTHLLEPSVLPGDFYLTKIDGHRRYYQQYKTQTD
ncbi:hydroxymethylglutaryl-CoA synthase [Facklamia hominis]|uniref:Hydroxymethylglutaryl-CoA synthase n=1 Tax=Facklamia hominis CCUG 36813 TaxID=883111 RepID=K1LMW7_9LACT|nr:hydroxymethylglutaryl-CoA synthase [Facklamia hominis]EKB56081.1 hydroxymethylglutaryl-CoA synthase [Facklamia hominis CCUG 36813]